MAMTKEQQVASLYNLKSQIDGMISAVRGGVLSIEQVLQVIASAMVDLGDRVAKGKEEE